MNVVRKLVSRRAVAWVSGGAVLAVGGSYWYLSTGPAYPLSTKNTRRPPPPWTPPSREQMLNALRAAGSAGAQGSQISPDAFDLLIVGGGATGAGVAVDAASRGLRVALVERDDFSAGGLSCFILVRWVALHVQVLPLVECLFSGRFSTYMQELRPSRPNWYMEAFDISRKPFLNPTTNSTSWSVRPSTKDASSCKRRLICLGCCPLCYQYTSAYV
jgi:FAD dependent oxidoreductase